MNWYLDVFADDYSDSNVLALGQIRRIQECDRSGPCEDDVEVTAPYVDLLPEETEHETPSPLEFGAKQGQGESIGLLLVKRPKA